MIRMTILLLLSSWWHRESGKIHKQTKIKAYPCILWPRFELISKAQSRWNKSTIIFAWQHLGLPVFYPPPNQFETNHWLSTFKFATPMQINRFPNGPVFHILLIISGDVGATWTGPFCCCVWHCTSHLCAADIVLLTTRWMVVLIVIIVGVAERTIDTKNVGIPLWILPRYRWTQTE